jgi:F-type H+-transporting ATPase subunit b
MLIDWFTVAAQILNFIILVWLLKRFLYKPILDAVAARELRITKELANADSIKTEAEQMRDEFQSKNQTFEAQREKCLKQVTGEVATEREILITQARKDAEALRLKAIEALQKETTNLNQTIGHKVQAEVFAITRQVLWDLASQSLEQLVSAKLIEKLRAMDDNTREEFSLAFGTKSDPALLLSAFELPTEQRHSIQDALREIFGNDIQLKFEMAPNLIGGIELSANGQKIAWSIADYLDSMEQGVAALLKQPAETRTSDTKDNSPAPALQ